MHHQEERAGGQERAGNYSAWRSRGYPPWSPDFSIFTGFGALSRSTPSMRYTNGSPTDAPRNF